MNSSQLLRAGYVLARPTPTPQAFWAGLPANILTISDCIMDDLPRPDSWDWFTDQIEAISASPEDTQGDVEVITVAMETTEAREFMSELGGAEAPYFALLHQSQPLNGGAEVLGFEVVGAEPTLDFHSWHCHGYAQEVAEQVGISCNQLGLLATYTEAVRVRDWMLARPDAEQPAPVPWVVVALAREALV